MRQLNVIAVSLAAVVSASACGGATTTTTTTEAPASASGGESTSPRVEQVVSGGDSPAHPSRNVETVAPTQPAWNSIENPRARFLVSVGVPSAHDDSVRPEHLAHARVHTAHTLQGIEGVEVAPPHFDRASLDAAVLSRNLGGLVLECAVMIHDVDARGTHFAVSVAVLDQRTGDVIATLTGRATAPGPTSTDAEELALEGSLDSALRGLPRLLEARRPSRG